MEEYVIYLRKSRADIEAEAHGEGETLARHKAALQSLAENRKLTVTQVYAEVVSGETIAARPMMKKLLSEVERGIWTGVLVMEVERLARGDTIDQGVVAQAFKLSGTQIITPLKTYDPANELDEEYFEFGLFMSRREYKIITRRMQRGRLASVKEGKFAGNKPPYGYRRVKLAEMKGYTLEPVPEQADAVRLIFEWYVNGEQHPDGTSARLGYTKIAQRLDAMGFATVTGVPWSAATLKEILTNPVYIGKVRWNRRPQMKHVVDGKVVQERPRAKDKDITVMSGLHPPIVADSLFETAQAQFRRRQESPVPKGKTIQNPLAKVVVCGICGRTMVRKPYRSKAYPDTLVCVNRGCPNISTQLYLVEERLLAILEEWLKEYRLELEEAGSNMEAVELKIKRQAVTRLRNDLEKLGRQCDNLYNYFEQGIYTKEVFIERSEKLVGKREQIRSVLHKLQGEIADYEKNTVQKGAGIPRIARIPELYRVAGSPGEKNDLLKEVVEKVLYIKTKNGQCRGNSLDDFELIIYPRLP